MDPSHASSQRAPLCVRAAQMDPTIIAVGQTELSPEQKEIALAPFGKDNSFGLFTALLSKVGELMNANHGLEEKNSSMGARIAEMQTQLDAMQAARDTERQAYHKELHHIAMKLDDSAQLRELLDRTAPSTIIQIISQEVEKIRLNLQGRYGGGLPENVPMSVLLDHAKAKIGIEGCHRIDPADVARLNFGGSLLSTPNWSTNQSGRSTPNNAFKDDTDPADASQPVAGPTPRKDGEDRHCGGGREQPQLDDPVSGDLSAGSTQVDLGGSRDDSIVVTVLPRPVERDGLSGNELAETLQALSKPAHGEFLMKKSDTVSDVFEKVTALWKSGLNEIENGKLVLYDEWDNVLHCNPTRAIGFLFDAKKSYGEIYYDIEIE